MHPKHILILYTGGTIGMEKTPRGYAPMADFPAVLQRLLAAHSDSLPRVTVQAFPTPIDSTNARPGDWRAIGQAVADAYDAFDGFVILHGTDTMAFSASALSFMLMGLAKPVIFTGSQIPLGEARSDALRNMVAALQLAADDAVREVGLCFDRHLFRGNRATKVSSARFDAFGSPNHPALADIGIRLRFAPSNAPPAGPRAFRLPEVEEGKILPLRLAPGMPAAMVKAMLDLQPRALILDGYGAGNVPDRDPALTRLLTDAGRRGIVLAVRTQCAQGGVDLGAYAAGSFLSEANAVGCADMTFEAVYTKLHHLFALGIDAESVKEELVRNWCGELTPTP